MSWFFYPVRLSSINLIRRLPIRTLGIYPQQQFHSFRPTVNIVRSFEQQAGKGFPALLIRNKRMSSSSIPSSQGLAAQEAAVAEPTTNVAIDKGSIEGLTKNGSADPTSAAPGAPIPFTGSYPKVRKDEAVVETLHGIKVADPYRWLEDPDSEETRQFVDQQNKLSSQYIDSGVDKEAIKARLTELWDYPKYTCTSRRGNNYYYRYNTGLQNQSVIYKQKSLDAPGEVFLDPNELSSDGTVSINFTSFSRDGKYMAYGLSQSGSDWVTIKIRDVESGNDLSDIIEKAKFTSATWTHDGLGFFYSRYPDSQKQDGTETTRNEFHRTYYHRLNTSQSEDTLVVEFPQEPKWMSGIEVSDDGNTAFVFVKEGCQNERIFYTSLENGVKPSMPLTPLITEFTNEYSFVASDGDYVYLLTNRNAPRYRLIKMNIKEPQEEKWTEVIPQHEKDVLDSVMAVNGNQLMCHWMRDVASALERRSLEDGKLIQAYTGLPIGTIDALSGRRIQNEVFFTLSNFLTPSVLFYQDLNEEKAELKLLREVKLNKFDPSQFITKQIFYTSKDGTRVPMFIVHHKDVKQDENNICWLYGYGGFNISLQPYFSVQRLLLLDNLKGVFALANIRGGGEYGESWHSGGTYLNKQNVFDDFIAAAEYLIGEKYTKSSRLCIEGGSNGGLLVGACSNQRPDLFGASVAQVGVMDMLRFHKFTIGHAWCTDYGNPDEEAHFKNILKYSPVHNVPNELAPGVTYPALLLTTADHDDRVVPLHSLKFIAAVQDKLGNKNGTVPLIIKVDTKAGHGAGKPTAKIIEERSDVYAFVCNALGAKFK